MDDETKVEIGGVPCEIKGLTENELVIAAPPKPESEDAIH